MNEFLTENKILLLTMFILNAFVSIKFFVRYRIKSSRKKLEELGFSEEYIFITQKLDKAELFNMYILLYATQFLIGIVLSMFSVTFTPENYGIFVFGPAIIVIMTYHLITTRKRDKKLKDVAIKTNSDIVIDFNHKTLRYVFNLPLEIIATILLIYFALAAGPVRPIFIAVALLPWFFYLSLRLRKNLNIDLFRYHYLITAQTNIVLKMLTILLLGKIAKNEPFFESTLSTFANSLKFVVLAALAGKVVYYLFNYEKLEKTFDKKPKGLHGFGVLTGMVIGLLLFEQSAAGVGLGIGLGTIWDSMRVRRRLAGNQ